MLRSTLFAVIVTGVVLVSCAEGPGGVDNGVSAPSSVATQYATTHYPIVLHHGFLGFDRVFRVDYFYQVSETLKHRGFDVYTTRVSPVATIARRAEQLKEQIDMILRTTGSRKVNIVAHSMGGLDARYLVSVLGYGDRVASITTLGTPHRGSRLADLVLGTSGETAKLVMKTFAAVWNVSGDEADGEVDIRGALHDISIQFMTNEFNRFALDHPDVYYQSFAGETSLTGFGSRDRVDAPLHLTYALLKLTDGVNDGLVTRASAEWGDFRGTLPADHINLVGHLFGSTSASFHHLALYEEIGRGLASRGL